MLQLRRVSLCWQSSGCRVVCRLIRCAAIDGCSRRPTLAQGAEVVAVFAGAGWFDGRYAAACTSTSGSPAARNGKPSERDAHFAAFASAALRFLKARTDALNVEAKSEIAANTFAGLVDFGSSPKYCASSIAALSASVTAFSRPDS